MRTKSFISTQNIGNGEKLHDDRASTKKIGLIQQKTSTLVSGKKENQYLHTQLGIISYQNLPIYINSYKFCHMW